MMPDLIKEMFTGLKGLAEIEKIVTQVRQAGFPNAEWDDIKEAALQEGFEIVVEHGNFVVWENS